MIRKTTIDKISSLHQWSTLWQKCTTLQALKQTHAQMVINGFNSNRFALRELIYTSAMTISSAIDYAYQVFAHITKPDLFMWNTMIRGYAQSRNPLMAISLYAQMEKCHVQPDNYTFLFVLKACTNLSWARMGFTIHGKVVKFGFESNTFVRNTLIYFHANCGDIRIASEIFEGSRKTNVVTWSALTAGYARRGELGVARKLFDEMPVRDLFSWNVIITGYAKHGDMDNARELFNVVPKRDVVTWNVMIAGYVLKGEHEQAMDMFEEMRCAGEQPDEVTMLSIVSACADLGALDIGEKLHCSLLEMYSGNLSILISNALIDMYAKCGSINKALEVFHGMREKVKQGREYFNLMRYQYNIEPNIKHYGCMVDLLGRAGQLKEAFDFIDTMKIKPNAIIWRALLGACKVHGNIELGRCANEQLLRMRSDHSGDYVLLSNIYASKGEWDGVEKVRKLMDDSGVRKERGCSLVEADDKALMHVLPA